MTASVVTTVPVMTRSNGVDTYIYASFGAMTVRRPCDASDTNVGTAGWSLSQPRMCAYRGAVHSTEEWMITHDVRVYPSKDDLKRDDQLAWKIASVAADKVAIDKDVAEMIANRIIDNAAVAIAAINRRPVVSARDMALARPHKAGATVFGVASNKPVAPEWAAGATGP